MLNSGMRLCTACGRLLSDGGSDECSRQDCRVGRSSRWCPEPRCWSRPGAPCQCAAQWSHIPAEQQFQSATMLSIKGSVHAGPKLGKTKDSHAHFTKGMHAHCILKSKHANAGKYLEQCRGAPWHMGCARGTAQLQHKHQMSTMPTTADCLGVQAIIGEKRSRSLRHPSSRQEEILPLHDADSHLLPAFSAQDSREKVQQVRESYPGPGPGGAPRRRCSTCGR